MAEPFTSEQRQAFLDDVAAFAAGELSEERGAALLAAARQDPVIMQALRAEEALDKLLELYEFPELPQGLAARFWERFQREKLEGEPLGASRAWWVRIALPVAAAIVLAIGLIYLPPWGQGNAPQEIGGNPAPLDVPDEETEDDYVLPLISVDEPGEKPRELKADELRLLKAMDDARLQALGDLQDAEDARLMDTLDTLEGIEPHKD